MVTRRMDLEELEKIDSKKMFKVYDIWPDISRESYEQEFSKPEFNDIDHIVFAGMGGSGTIGDVFSSILSKNDIHTSVVKGYLLPKTVDENTLVVVTSVSGNTQEPLMVLKNSKNSKAKFIAFSSGGMIKKYALKNEINYQEIKMEHSPRASFPKYVFSMLRTLESVIPVKKSDVLDTISKMEIVRKNIFSNNLNENNTALNLAKWITGTPVLYYPWGLESAAIRFKNSLQENSKLHVMAEDIIEVCHNGVVSWEKDSIMQPILIQGHDDYSKTKERSKILKEFFNSKQIEYKEISSVKGSIISKIINLIYLFDYVSVYHSVISGIDPSPVSAIDFIKERLGKD
jgi:glucose/mannose-6-phosphate isomerase